jgi:hypothetical protein
MLRPGEAQHVHTDLEHTTPQVSSLEPEPKPTKRPIAPKWSASFRDRTAWCVWFLKYNPNVYNAFRQLADARMAMNPKKQISSEGTINTLRHDTNVQAHGDRYRINSNSKSLLARLYQLERPGAKLGNRKAWLDDLPTAQWDEIVSAWRNAKDAPLEFAVKVGEHRAK